MAENAFARILNRLDESDSAVVEKTAAAVASTPAVETRMLDTVRRVSESVTKTASVTPGTPAADLSRMAKEAASTEDAMLMKEAGLYGAALADGFMERFAQYDVALTQSGVKTASAPSDAIVKQAAEAGYQRAVVDMEKRAEAEFNRGYQETMQQVHKTAADTHYAGQAMANAVFERLSAEQTR